MAPLGKTSGGSPVNEVAWVQKKVLGDKTKRQQHESQWTHQGNAWQDDKFPKAWQKRNIPENNDPKQTAKNYESF